MNRYQQLLSWIAELETIRSSIGAFVRESREQLGLAPAALAKKLSITPAHLGDIETGKAKPSLELLKHLLELLKP